METWATGHKPGLQINLELVLEYSKLLGWFVRVRKLDEMRRPLLAQTWPPKQASGTFWKDLRCI